MFFFLWIYRKFHTFVKSYSLLKARVGKAGDGDIYIKGVTVRFGFDVLELCNFTIICQKQSNGDALWCVYTLPPEPFA